MNPSRKRLRIWFFRWAVSIGFACLPFVLISILKAAPVTTEHILAAGAIFLLGWMFHEVMWGAVERKEERDR